MAQTEEEHQTVRGAEEENKTDSLETTRSTTTTDKTAVSVKRRARERERERFDCLRTSRELYSQIQYYQCYELNEIQI